MSYLIYLLPGRKYGLTQNLRKRRTYYARHQTRLLRVVVELDDVKSASDLETRLNTEAGYRGQHPKYEHTTTMATREQRALGGRRSGRKGAELGIGIHRQTPEEKAALGRQGGLKGGRTARERGVGIFALTAEERAANSRKARAKAAETRDPERLAEQGRRLGAMRGVCEHCGTETNAGNLKQHHGDNCKLKVRLPLRRPA